jgi:hypothetical protein
VGGYYVKTLSRPYLARTMSGAPVVPAVLAAPGPSLELLGTEMASLITEQLKGQLVEIERLRAGAGEPRVRALQAESSAKLQMEQERHATERQHSLGDNGAAASAEPAGGAARCTAAVVMAMMMTQQRRRWSRCRARWLSTEHLRGS